MGGKTKQSQRTKNNVRPSSSGRSALLLSNVKLESGVINGAGQELPGLFPTLVAPNIDPMVSPELQLCIKKLNKKDPITKTKALQELSELVINSKVDDVVAALPSWAHFYKILTADPDRKVREATQSCHGAIVGVCGRRLAPHLKQLMPAWLQAQYDEHAPAQTNAQNSLAKTFPDSKLPEVISFCKSEVLAHLIDNLIGSGESAFIRKTDSPEEKEMQLARLVTSSLHGLQYVAQHLPAAHSAWLWEQLAPLLQANAFWKRAAHADPRIRAAWLGAAGSVVARFAAAFAARHGARLLRVLAAAERSPPAAAQLWDCLLLFMHNVEDWHQYLEKKELLSKRILDVLENGGWGDARHLSNMLLPLLAHLPPTMLTKEFYVTFFDAIFKGLEKKTILSSKSERQSWITSLDECLRYLSIQQEDYVLEIVTSVHRTWLERVLSDEHEGQIRTNLIKYSANSMAALVKYWLKQAKEGHGEKYDQLIRNFWQNVGSTITTQIDRLSTDHAEIGRLIDGHILSLQTLKTSFAQEAKRQQCISFDGDSPPVAARSPKETPQCDASIVERYDHNLNDLVEKVCGHYFEFAGKKEISGPVLTPLITLLAEFDRAGLFAAIARQAGAAGPRAWYDAVPRRWLAADAMRCRAVLDVVFLFVKHLPEEDQDAVFQTFEQFPPAVVEWCISLSLSHPHCVSRAARRWMRGPLVDATVASICRRVTDLGDAKAKDLLLLCLNNDASGEMIISKRAVSIILGHFSRAVASVEAPALELVAGLAARLATTLTEPGLHELVLGLFQLSVLVPRGSPRLTLHTWREVRAAWQDGLAALAPAARAALHAAAAAAVHRHLSLRDESLDMQRMEHVVSLCPYLLSYSCQRDVTEIVEFSRQILDAAPAAPPSTPAAPAAPPSIPAAAPPAPAAAPPPAAEAHARRHSVVRGDLSCPLGDGAEYEALDELSSAELLAYVGRCVFRTMYLKTILLHKVDEDLEDTWCDDLLTDDYFVTELGQVLHDFMVVCVLCEAYGFSPHYVILKETKDKLDSLIHDVIEECAGATRGRLLRALGAAAAARGYYWAFARRWFEVEANLYKTENSQASERNTDETTTCEIKTESGPRETGRGQSETGGSREDAGGSRDGTEGGQSAADDNGNRGNDINIDSDEFLDIERNLTGNGYFHILQADGRWRAAPGAALRTRHLLMRRALHAAHAAPAPAPAPAEAAAAATAGADFVIDLYYAHNHIMLYEKDITKASWSHVASNAAIVEYLTELVAAEGWRLPPHHWDFITITLCHSLASVLRSKGKWGCTKVALFARAALRLHAAVDAFVRAAAAAAPPAAPAAAPPAAPAAAPPAAPAAASPAAPPAHVALLPQEWRDIFAPELEYSLFSVILFILDSSGGTTITANHIGVMEALVESARRLRWRPLAAPHRAGALALRRAAGAACAALRRPAHYCHLYLAYELLAAVREPLVLEDAEKLAAWSAEAGEEEGEARARPQLSLAYYDDAFFRLRDIVDTAVSHVKVCEETCALVPFSDVHVLALGWLLLADALAAQLRLARGDLRHHYIQIYRDQKYAEPLLPAALRLLPPRVLAAAQHGAAPAPRDAALFASLPPLRVHEYCAAETVSAAACRGVALCVTGAGAGEARGWRGAAPHRHARLLDNIVRGYITPNAVKEQFLQVQQRAAELEDTEVTLHWSTYEVTCILTVEERPVELKVQLSREHPLGLPRFTAQDHAPAANTNWLVMYMGYQNGSLLNALKMWTGAVNSKVERSAQCYICYCRLHFATGRLPSVLCYQCRNKFHTDCLRKWFRTSNRSNCPLCRTSF